jgi:DNA-binding transcriptional MerR regulator
MQNDTKDLIPIREFSAITGIPVSTLRYYDDTGLFLPAYRAESGYRFYAPPQIITVKFVRVLIDCGMPLKAISALEKERTPQELIVLLREQAIELDREVRRLQENAAILDTFRTLITMGLLAAEDGICIEKTSTLPLTYGPENRFSETENTFYHAYVRFLQETPGIHMSYPVGGYFTDMEQFLASPGQPLRFFSLDPTGADERPAGSFLTGYTRGYYGETNDLPARMRAYAEENGLELTGPVYNIFLHDEVSVRDPGQYLMQASVAVAS